VSAAELEAAIAAKLPGTSPRDCELVALLMQGMDYGEIAQQLGIGRRTVKAHMSHLFLRFGITEAGKNKRVLLIIKLEGLIEIVPPASKVHLTPRQEQVLARVAEGYTNVAIGAELGISESVVKNYLRAVYDAIGVWHRTEAAIWYRAHKKQEPLPE
jgi:DNA-binding CsgD family transcriptional regulator